MSVLEAAAGELRPAASGHPVAAARARSWPRDALDRSLAVVLLLALAPLLLVLVLAIRVSSRGPAIYRQERVGLHGRRFGLVKLRTMWVDADAHRPSLHELNEGAGPLFKIRRDPRITRVGRVLRRLSLDELPQLVNVIRGEMALVGPRPALPHEVSTYDPFTARRLAVKPGITGLWQVSGRSDLPWRESVRLDLEYVSTHSLGLDLLILLRTVGAVVGGRGAY